MKGNKGKEEKRAKERKRKEERIGEERRGEERSREQEERKVGLPLLALPSKLLHIAVTSKQQHERPHAYNMQMRIYILHVSLICISNTLAFVFQIHSTKHTRFSPNLGAPPPRSHRGAARARSQLMIPTDR